MPWTVNYDSDSDCVVTVYEGKLTAEDLRAEEEQSLALAIEKGTKRFLVDLVNYESSISPLHLLESPARYEEKLTRPIFVAVLEPLSHEARKDSEFYETICVNRGWTVATFATKEDAIAWLLEKKSGPTP